MEAEQGEASEPGLEKFPGEAGAESWFRADSSLLFLRRTKGSILYFLTREISQGEQNRFLRIQEQIARDQVRAYYEATLGGEPEDTEREDFWTAEKELAKKLRSAAQYLPKRPPALPPPMTRASASASE